MHNNPNIRVGEGFKKLIFITFLGGGGGSAGANTLNPNTDTRGNFLP